MPLTFHWRLPHGGETSGSTMASQRSLPAIGLPDLEAQLNFCKHAEQCGIDSLLTDFGFAKPDPILLAATLGMATERIKFIVAYRSGLLSPTAFVQQLNSLSILIEGRFSLNIVAGYSPPEQRSYGDFLSHDERYERTDEFLSICHALWSRQGAVSFKGKYYHIENGDLSTPFISKDRASPKIFIAGSSPPAQRLALRQGTCWISLAEPPERVRKTAQSISRRGIEVGLRLSVITRSTRKAARDAAYSLIAQFDVQDRERKIVGTTDSRMIKQIYHLAESEWLTHCFWTGAVRYIGPTAVALVGTPEEVASAFLEYRESGVSQFVLSGWPKLEEMIRFGRDVLPIIREMETRSATQAPAYSAAIS
jgi:alkanesulfonate monooxygenase